ncbi:MAG: glycosyltransferase family 39 protein [Elusimicrobiota bacterium]
MPKKRSPAPVQPAASAPPGRPELWIFSLSLTLRLAHLFLYKDDFWLRTPLLDDNVFFAWSETIMKEGWLAKSLGVFHLNPCYPYLLALLGKLVGRGPVLVFSLQHVLGAFAPVLCFRLSDRLFGRRAAWLAAGLAAFYGPAFFFESRYLGELFIYVLNLGFLCALLEAEEAPTPEPWFTAAGLALGLSAVFRPTGLILLPLAAAWGAWALRGRRLALSRSAFLFAVMVWLPLLPFQWRNHKVDPASGWGLTTASGGVNLFMGNNPEADGLNKPAAFVHGGPEQQYEDYTREAERLKGRKMSAKEVDRYWSSRARQWFSARPAEAWALVWRKAGYFWNHREPPDNFFPSIFQKYCALGGVPLIGWALIAPAGLWGALLAGRRSGAWLLRGYLLAYLAVNALFFVLSRYRFPAAAALIPFSALALARLSEAAQEKAWGRAALLALLLAPCLWLTRLPLIGEEDLAVSHYSMAVIYANQGWQEKAVEQYHEAIKADASFAAAYLNLGVLQAQRGQLPESVWALEKAATLDQDPERVKQIRRSLELIKKR